MKHRKRQAELHIYQPRSSRYETIEEALADLAAGGIDSFVGSEEELGSTRPEEIGLRVLDELTGSKASSFVLGTNQIGQDILSRIIWGTRIALIVGLSSALVSFLIGVPLGLVSGFVGGTFDRVLTMVMDSLYTFPGLILAICYRGGAGSGYWQYYHCHCRSVHSHVLQHRARADPFGETTSYM